MNGKFSTSPLTMPMFEEHTPIKDALEQIEFHSTDDMISTDGADFWLLTRPDLINADPSRTVGTFVDRPLRKLTVTEVNELGLDLGILREGEARVYLPSPDIGFVIASIVRSKAGEPTVVAFVNPNENFRVVSSVWVCPKGREVYRSPGRCRIHNRKLEPG